MRMYLQIIILLPRSPQELGSPVFTLVEPSIQLAKCHDAISHEEYVVAHMLLLNMHFLVVSKCKLFGSG